MFVALNIRRKTRVTSIAPEWDNAEEVLRQSAADGELVCPGCKQLLWLRTGTTRRRHFAHRSLADCPLAHQSAEVLEVKAQLYQWLEIKYPGKASLDVTLKAGGCDRNIDLLVEREKGRKSAYWVFDRQQRDRDEFFACHEVKGLSLHFVHTASTLKLQDQESVLLTASQRDFIAVSGFDSGVERPGFGHLHFVDAEHSTLSIYRGLYCAHRPNVYRFAVLRTGLLNSALISPATGEIVFAEDVEARKAWRERQTARHSVTEPPKPACPPAPVPVDPEIHVEPIKRTEEPSWNMNGPFRCEDCGTVTMDWSQATPSAGTCICRSCSKNRWVKARSEPPKGSAKRHLKVFKPRS